MFKRSTIRSIVATAVVGLALSVSAGPAAAGEVCDPKKTTCPPPACDPKKQNCEPECDPKKQNCEPVCDPTKDVCDVCHNIGGPRALGANCDAGNCTLEDMIATGNADLIAAFEEALLVCSQHDCDPADIYGGIVVPYADAAYTAHYNHGDGLTLVTFDRVHETQPHVAANVGCFAVRHDPDPGN